MQTMGIIVLAVLAFGARSEASCRSLTAACFCLFPNAQLLVTQSVDGGSAVLRVEADAGLATLSAQAGESPGARWLQLDGNNRRAVDAQGNVGCPESTIQLINAEAAARAAVSATCDADLDAAGFKEPPCNDTSGCAVSPVTFLPLLALAWFFRRR